MLNHRSVRIRVIGLLFLAAALLGYFAGRTGAHQVEYAGPDFLVLEAGVAGDTNMRIWRALHLKTGTCFIKEPAFNFVLAPPEVCK